MHVGLSGGWARLSARLAVTAGADVGVEGMWSLLGGLPILQPSSLATGTPSLQPAQHRKGTRPGRKKLTRSTSRVTAKPHIWEGGKVLGSSWGDMPAG